MTPETRSHDFTVLLDAPPEVVWRALTDGEAITRWFAPEARVVPGAGGSITLSWGPGMEGTEPIHSWEPETRFSHGPAGNGKLVDYHITPGEGGGTVLRLVHSGFSAEARANSEYESTLGGWSTFLAMLRFGLERHAGAPHQNVTVLRPLPVGVAAGWDMLTGERGLRLEPEAAALTEGARYTATLPNGEEVHGVVLRKPRDKGYLCLTVEEHGDALLSLFVEPCGTTFLTVTTVLFGEATERAEALRSAWTAWADGAVVATVFASA